MIEFLTSFIEIYLFPWDPIGLDIEQNPIMSMLLCVFVVCGIVSVWRRVWSIF